MSITKIRIFPKRSNSNEQIKTNEAFKRFCERFTKNVTSKLKELRQKHIRSRQIIKDRIFY